MSCTTVRQTTVAYVLL